MMRLVQLLIGDVFRRNARACPGAPAASLGERSISHGELDAAGNRTARALANLGVRRGDRVACWAGTSLDVLPLFVGLSKLGAVFAPVDAVLGPGEAAPIVGRAHPALLVAGADHVEAAEGVAREAGVPRLARLGGAGPGIDLCGAAEACNDAEFESTGLVETDPHVIFFTSGSTGRPKGVVLSHRANTLRSAQGVFRDEPERSVCMFPLFHMAAFTLALAAWQTRGEITFVESPTAEALLAAVERRRANRLYCIPAVWARIFERDFPAAAVATLREVDTGTSATPPELVAELKRRFPGARTRIYYGSTEAGAGTALADADVLRKPASVGLPVPGVDLRLAGSGEVLLRSPYLMDGYFEDETATSAALVDGWYHTGDLGALDDEGYLSIVGRLRDVIRTGGETVAPLEVEAVLADHPTIAEVVVVGLPDPQWGEIVCAAVVVAKPGVQPTLEDLQRHCDKKLAHFKRPRRLALLDGLPRTPATGQVQRALIAERIASRKAAPSES